MRERQKAMEALGISVSNQGVAIDAAKYYLVNLNEDPSMTGMLVYHLEVRAADCCCVKFLPHNAARALSRVHSHILLFFFFFLFFFFSCIYARVCSYVCICVCVCVCVSAFAHAQIPETKVGSQRDPNCHSIVFSGIGIRPQHAVITISATGEVQPC